MVERVPAPCSVQVVTLLSQATASLPRGGRGLFMGGLVQQIPFGEQRARQVKERVGLWGRLRRPHNPTPHPFPTQGALPRKPYGLSTVVFSC